MTNTHYNESRILRAGGVATTGLAAIIAYEGAIALPKARSNEETQQVGDARMVVSTMFPLALLTAYIATRLFSSARESYRWGQEQDASQKIR